MRKCYVCGRERLDTNNDANDVWVIDGDRLICGRCYIRVMDKLCDKMELEQKQREEERRIREAHYIYEAFNGDYGTT